MSSPHIINTSDASFAQDVLKSDKPVLLDFWAEWCGPCKMIAPILDELAGVYADRVRIAKLNIDENPQTPPKFGIRGIPTLILFKNGTVEARRSVPCRARSWPHFWTATCERRLPRGSGWRRWRPAATGRQGPASR